MKTPTKLILIAALVTALASCASMDAPNQTSMLSAAGFVQRTPQTQQQRELYEAAEPYKVLKASLKDHVFYAYKDEKNGVAYVGGEQEYQQYQRLALEQKIANQQMMAAQMNYNSAMNWYGAWGSDPFIHGPRVRHYRR